MNRCTLFASMTLFAFFLVSCGGGQKPAVSEEPVEKVAPVEYAGLALAKQLEMGERIFKEKCIACHQADAKGLPGVFPPLAQADYLLADLKRAVAQTLNGSHEEMLINGVIYNQPMPPQVETIEEAMAVINYVLKTFNGFQDDELVKFEDVKDIEINPIQI